MVSDYFDLENDGVWQVAFVLGSYSFIFIGNYYSLDLHAVITWVIGDSS